MGENTGSHKLVILSWEEFFDDVLYLASKLEYNGYDVLVVIARGGLVVGRLLSDLLNVKRVTALTIEYYRGVEERGSEPKIVGDLGLNVEGLKVLIVDDVADTGVTLKAAVEFLAEKGAESVETCSIYVKPWCSYKPKYFSKMIEGWIVFPYEHLETSLYFLNSGWSFDQLTRVSFHSKVLEYLHKKLMKT
ncbi:MAG: phosphoribosyltransferase [Thermofilaceae archaeon]|nr:phosphoribosyltransferase [Thermofilaceae archaeon]